MLITEYVYKNTLKFYRALDKREYLVIIRDNFCSFCIETYVVTPNLNHLSERREGSDEGSQHMVLKELRIRPVTGTG